MIRNILSVFAGVVAAFIIIMGVEYINSMNHPFPQGMNPNDAENFKAYVAGLPISALLVVVLGWALGSLLCGFVIGKINPNSASKRLPIVAGAALTIASILNMVEIPHPTWMMIVGIVIFIPLTMLGYRLAMPKLLT
jgi:hypothetical protein